MIENIKPAIEEPIIMLEEDEEAIVEAVVLAAKDTTSEDNIVDLDQKTLEKEHHHKNSIHKLK